VQLLLQRGLCATEHLERQTFEVDLLLELLVLLHLRLEILEAQEAAAKWQRRKLISDLQDKAIYVLACLVVVGFIVLMMYAIVLDRRVRWGF
jgi:hypothetical protein